MENIISGKEYLENVEIEVKAEAKNYIIRPSVAVIQIGSSIESSKYVKIKEEICNKVGIYFRYFNYDESTPELTIINKIKELNNDDYVNGIMVELPLPDKYNEKRLLNTISNSKDIDGLTDINIGRLISGRKTIISCTALGIMELFKINNIDLNGKYIVLVGKSRLIGRPLMNLLLDEGSTVTVCHTKTIDLKKYTKDADIIISATGVKDLITEDMVKDDVIVIDAGCSIIDDKMYGDVKFDTVSKKAKLITPVPGGVGPMTLSMFLKNILLCYNSKK